MVVPAPLEMKTPSVDVLQYPFTSLLLTESVERDVDVVVEEQRYKAHKSILCACSPIFNTMLTSGMRESVQKEVTLKACKKKTWEIVSTFIYSGTVEIEDEPTALDLVYFAHQYEMKLLMSHAGDKLKECMNKENAVQRLVQSIELGLHGLREKAKQMIDKYFLVIYETEEFKKLPFHIMDEILGRDKLQIISELDIFEAISGWAQHPTAEIFSALRIAEARYLCRNIDATQMGVDDLKIFAKLPSLRPYTESLPDLINHLSMEPTGRCKETRRYTPHLQQNRLTILFEMECITADWRPFAPPCNANLNVIPCVQIRERCVSVKGWSVENIIEMRLLAYNREKNIRYTDFFILENNRNKKPTVSRTSVGRVFSFGKLNRDEKHIIMFGADVFFE